MTTPAGPEESWLRAHAFAGDDLVQRAAVLAGVGVTYYLGARIGLSLSLVEHNVTPLWPPTGVALAAFLILGRATWPAVALAAFVVNLPISTDPLAAAVTAAGNTAAPLLAALLFEYVGFRRQLDRQRDALAIVFLGALGSMLVSATVGATTLAVSGAIDLDGLPSAWAVWWTGDAMGVLAVTPFLLCLPLYWEARRLSRARLLETAAMLGLTTVVVATTVTTDVQLLFLTLPVLGWTAWRLQLRGAAPAALIASLVATWAATRELGPFDHGSLLLRMVTLQAFNASIALTSFFLSAMVSERMRAAEALASAATREHHIAETLQRALLPEAMPDVPGVTLAARYVPATADTKVGGDWYDALQLRDGLIGLAIGDVAGHGVPAAATMAQLRMALRGYALQDPSPVRVMTQLHDLVSHLAIPEMVTLLYLVFDPESGALRFSSAGHVPALVVGDGGTDYLRDGAAPPLGVTTEPEYDEASHVLEPGTTLVLYTDGLVERRGASIHDGLDRLALEAARNRSLDVEQLCDHLLTTLTDASAVADDIALVVLRPVPLRGAPLVLSVPAEPRTLVQVRQALRRWLHEGGIASRDENDLLVACGEACANVIRHAYGTTSGDLTVEARLVGEEVELVVADQGGWKPPADLGGGWGLQLIEGLVDTVVVDRGPGGTTVRMTRAVVREAVPR